VGEVFFFKGEDIGGGFLFVGGGYRREFPSPPLEGEEIKRRGRIKEGVFSSGREGN